jgi:hypothetical protein
VLENCKLRFRYLLTTDEIVDTAVLKAAGLEAGLNSKEDEAALQSSIRSVVFQPDTGRIKIEFSNTECMPDRAAERKSGDI